MFAQSRALIAVMWLGVFGAISRRFEWQADLFGLGCVADDLAAKGYRRGHESAGGGRAVRRYAAADRTAERHVAAHAELAALEHRVAHGVRAQVRRGRGHRPTIRQGDSSHQGAADRNGNRRLRRGRVAVLAGVVAVMRARTTLPQPSSP